jgi:hypothetical protein
MLSSKEFLPSSHTIPSRVPLLTHVTFPSVLPDLVGREFRVSFRALWGYRIGVRLLVIIHGSGYFGRAFRQPTRIGVHSGFITHISIQIGIPSGEADGVLADESAWRGAVVAVAVVGQASNRFDVAAGEAVMRLVRCVALPFGRTTMMPLSFMYV